MGIVLGSVFSVSIHFCSTNICKIACDLELFLFIEVSLVILNLDPYFIKFKSSSSLFTFYNIKFLLLIVILFYKKNNYIKYRIFNEKFLLQFALNL